VSRPTTNHDVSRIKTLRAEGLSRNKIATHLNIAPSVVRYWTDPAYRKRNCARRTHGYTVELK